MKIQICFFEQSTAFWSILEQVAALTSAPISSYTRLHEYHQNLVFVFAEGPFAWPRTSTPLADTCKFLQKASDEICKLSSTSSQVDTVQEAWSQAHLRHQQEI